MTRVTPVSVAQASGELSELYSAIKAGLGGVPNLFLALGANTKVLKGFLGIGESLKASLLSGKEKESIALAVAEANGCDYCLAAHSVLGKMRGIKDEEIESNRSFRSEDTKRQALLTLVEEIVLKKGRVSEATFKAFLAAGYTEAHIPEVFLVTAENIFTNYFNNFNGTEVDFPAVKKLMGSPSCECETRVN